MVIRKEIKPIGKYTLLYGIKNVKGKDHLEIILNHKFNIFNGFRNRFMNSEYKETIISYAEIQVEKYIIEYGPVKKWKIYVNSKELEEEILKQENEWYDSRISYLKSKKKGGLLYDNEI